MENRLRVELLIAACALLLTGIASIASVYQAHMIARQFSSTEQQFGATVWPYLTIAISQTPTTIQSSITNDGLGPAIIRSAAIGWDGTRSFGSWRDMATVLITLSSPPKARSGLSFVGSTSSLDPGDVIRAGESRSLFSLRGWNGFPEALERDAIRHGLTVSICYCSLLRTCWMKRWKAQLPSATALQDVEPYEIRSCPAPHGISG
ncbi:MAG: hypothetical protein WCC84_09865 [Candidatus Cybelea sp.]